MSASQKIRMGEDLGKSAAFPEEMDSRSDPGRSLGKVTNEKKSSA